MSTEQKSHQRTRRTVIIWSLFFLVILLSFFFYHERRINQLEAQKVATHAKVVSTSLWTYEKLTPTNYLALAVSANGYKQVTVKDDHGNIFLQLEGKELSAVESTLASLELIHNTRFTEDIIYEGDKIGTIEVEWLSKALYLYLYIMFCMALLLIGITLFLKLLDANRLLENRVKERTAQLEKEIQEHKITAKKLQYQAQRLAMHVQHTPLGVVEWSPSFKLINWNNAAEKIFGYSKEEVVGRHPFDFLVPKSDKAAVQMKIDTLRQDQVGNTNINTNITKSGEIKTCTWYNTPLKDNTGKLIGIAALVQDITEQVETEKKNKLLHKQLVQAQKMEAIGNLAGGIAHDFNNILQSISGYTQLLLIECKKREGDCTKLEKIDKVSQRAAMLVKKLLTFSRGVESRLAPINLNQEIESIQNVLEQTIPKMVTITKKLDTDLLPLMGDSVQLEQIILNMAINANHAMPDGGELTIETRNVLLDEHFCNNNLGAIKGQNVLLRISDTGVGMSKEVQEQIFDPFFTTRDIGKGTGLGLSTVYGILSEHNAYINCSSEEGKGTAFDIYFPAVQESPFQEAAAETNSLLPEGTETILLVDDEQTIREIGEQLLETLGYSPLMAVNGKEGIEFFQKYRKNIKLIVMDLNMPGMGGQQCITNIRQLDADIPILVASGYTPPETIAELNELNVAGIIPKPFMLESFLQTIRKTLDESR